ncbi:MULTISPECIES: pre-toxin TG domain-containing protein [unclassified Enterococcus]|uniref:pre-toxin TG domain-containing protein n=1 Tax=unclassified Enterococcus TaxID=2608891 RepID=UPI001CE0F280|nr:MULTISPECIES: pre-toxin TG domain-containing protein [unclassified Enterococcus]MCA5014415.1 hypothetical protein [Enterococcus sp. S23]MCA5017472.1 hypothetical protein [Enterococcus sp. S22(2020)]
MKDVKFKTGEWSSIVNGVSELKDVDIITLVQELGTITNDAKDACDRYDVDNAIDIESMDNVLMDDLDERIAKLAQKTFKIQDTLPADIDQPFYDSMDSLIEKLSNMNIMGYETMARGSFSNGVNSAGVAMPKMKVTLEDLLGSSSPLTDYLRVEYDKMKQEIGDVSFEDYQKMAFADTSFDYYSRNEKVKDLAVTVVINGAVLVIGGMLPWQLMVALGLTSGAKNVSDAWRGKDLFTGKELSTGDRILRGLSGIADLALAGYGTYKGLKPLKGTNKVVVSEKSSTTNKLLKPDLLDELSKSGVKYNPDDVVMVTKNIEKDLLWLEYGNSKAGLNHVEIRHAADFSKRGIKNIPEFIYDMLKNKPVSIVESSRGMNATYLVNGKKYLIAYGKNGFIVSVYPI